MKRITTILLTMLYVIPSFSQMMEWHIKNNYVDIKYMGNNLFKVKNPNGKWGVINEYGEMTIETLYDSITHIVENRALLLDLTGQYLKGIINEKGQIIRSFHNNEIVANCQYYNEGMLAYGIATGNYYLFGYLDMNGNTCIQPKYYWAAPFSNGKAVVQYKSKNYGLIDNSGGTALNDNRKFKFMSTPVDNRLLIAVSSNRGEKVALVKLEHNGKLTEIEELEGGTIVRNSSDYKRISCQNGHSYYFDNAMRLISSSTGKTFNEPLAFNNLPSGNSAFSKVHDQEGWKILHGDKTLSHSSFREVTFCGNEYAIVVSQRGNMGVLKLNSNGSIDIQNVISQAEFYHNRDVKGNLAINIDGAFSSSQIQIGIVGLKGNNLEEKYAVPAGYSGIYNLPISYFIPADNIETEVSLPIKVNLYIDGMLYNSEDKILTGIHKRAFRISDATAPEYSDPNGNASITFNIESLDSAPSASAKIIISGASNQSRRFNGEEMVYLKIPVTIPVESVKTFSLTVTIKEDGCPSYTKTISKTIKHYDLQ